MPGIHENLFNRGAAHPRVRPLAPAAAGGAQPLPVGRPIGRARKTLAVHERFHQPDRVPGVSATSSGPRNPSAVLAPCATAIAGRVRGPSACDSTAGESSRRAVTSPVPQRSGFGPGRPIRFPRGRCCKREARSPPQKNETIFRGRPASGSPEKPKCRFQPPNLPTTRECAPFFPWLALVAPPRAPRTFSISSRMRRASRRRDFSKP